MAQSDLERDGELRPAGSQRGEEASSGRADVGAEGKRVHALDLDHADSHKRCEGGSEDGAALHEHRHEGARQHGHVSGETRERSREVGVQRLLDHLGDGTLQHGVEQLDNQHEARAQKREGEDQK